MTEDAPQSLTEAQLSEIEARAADKVPLEWGLRDWSNDDLIVLIREVRRLRSLFTERDATLCWEMAEIIGRRKPSHARDKQVADYRDLEARIRSAIGETRE